MAAGTLYLPSGGGLGAEIALEEADERRPTQRSTEKTRRSAEVPPMASIEALWGALCVLRGAQCEENALRC